MKGRALLSCHDKTGLRDLAGGLARLGFQIVSTGGTAAHLRDGGVRVVDVSEVTGFPEILDGRVKTLHPAIHAGILARDHPSHDAALRDLGLGRIDLVAVNLYPFATVAARADATMEELIENIDIGGPAMLRSAAKNHERVIVLVDPSDYGPVLSSMERGGPDIEERRRLALKVYRHTALYDAAIAARLSPPTASGLPSLCMMALEQVLALRYGENPHQPAAYYEPAGVRLGFDVAKRGKELSHNNLLDVDAAWGLATALGGTAAVVVKHANPCGVAVGDDLASAYRRARDADAESAFGSIVGLTRPLDAATAAAIGETFVEVVAAPEIGSEAREILAGKKNLRLVEMGPEALSGLGRALEIRPALSGFLVQRPDVGADPEPSVVTRRAPTEDERRDLAFAMTVCRHVKSNAIVLVKNRCTTGIGAGQMSRVESVRIATRKAGPRAAGSVMASDAFFPFPDSLVEAHEAGVTAVIQPGGSVKDKDVIDEADRRGMAMLVTGRRHFRH